MGVLSKENVIFGLKVAAVISLGNFAGATGYIQTAVQPALIAQEDATQAAQTMSDILDRSKTMPLSCLSSIACTTLVYILSEEKNNFWLGAAVTSGLVIPYTAYFFRINGIFRKVGEESEKDRDWGDLLRKWKKYNLARALVMSTLFGLGVYTLATEK